MTLHIYAQPYPHSDCFVLGTVEDLKRLANSILEACDAHMSTGKETENFFTSDGEGYTVKVVRLTEAELDRTRLPYTNEFDEDRRKDVTSAWEYFVMGS